MGWTRLSQHQCARRLPVTRYDIRMPALVLYDGYCVLCNRMVGFLAPRQKRGALEFDSLQSARGQAVLKECGLSITDLDTFVLQEKGRCYIRSRGALRVVRHLRFPWGLLYGLIVVPAFLRDPLYNWVARNRFKWFGRIEQ